MLKSLFASLAAGAISFVLSIQVQAETFATLWPDIAADPGASEITALLEKLDFQTGTVMLPGGKAQLEQGDAFYYLSPKDSEYVLTELWGNPPGGAQTLGMVFPRWASPLHDTWGMVLDYSAMGHVKDDDAANTDFDALLRDMQADARESSKQRISQGYESVALIGWAEPPHYDATERKLYWAKELQFGSSEKRTLNYNIRVLGREGVLNMNIVGGMEHLDMIRSDAPAVMAMTSFTDGNRYTDFRPGVDKVAAVGIGGLIAGKVLAKTGAFAVVLLALKKFWFVLFLPLIWLKRLFARRRQS